MEKWDTLTVYTVVSYVQNSCLGILFKMNLWLAIVLLRGRSPRISLAYFQSAVRRVFDREDNEFSTYRPVEIINFPHHPCVTPCWNWKHAHLILTLRLIFFIRLCCVHHYFSVFSVEYDLLAESIATSQFTWQRSLFSFLIKIFMLSSVDIFLLIVDLIRWISHHSSFLSWHMQFFTATTVQSKFI